MESTSLNITSTGYTNSSDGYVQIFGKSVSEGTVTRIIEAFVYSIYFILGAPANTRVLYILLNNRLYLKSRHHKLLTNLAAADTIVCLLQIPTEIIWRIVGDWYAGTIGCKIFAVYRVFGLYASSMILIVISIDRYYAVSHPFAYATMGSRMDIFLFTAWFVAFSLSLAQVCSNIKVKREKKSRTKNNNKKIFFILIP